LANVAAAQVRFAKAMRLIASPGLKPICFGQLNQLDKVNASLATFHVRNK
jgi:hypothetical protein